MGGFKLGKMTFGSLFKKPETTQYPFEKKPAPAGLKGHVENNIDICILCGICEKRCPADAITVDKEKRTWECNGYQCIQCNTCVRECPKQCLSMLPEYTKVSTQKTKLVVEVPVHEKQTESKEEKLAKLDPEKAAKVKAALEAKKKREAAKA